MRKRFKTIFGVTTALTVLSVGAVTAFANTDGMGITKSGVWFLRTATATESGMTVREKAGVENTFTAKCKAFESLTDTQTEALMSETKAQMKAALDELVSSGTITQDMADQLQAKGEAMRFERPELTDEQKAQMKNARLEMTDEQKAQMKNARPELTDEQKDKLKDRFNSKKQERPYINGLDMTEEQITAVRDAMQKAYTAAIEKLVSNGVITQQQADELNSIESATPSNSNDGII